MRRAAMGLLALSLACEPPPPTSPLRAPAPGLPAAPLPREEATPPEGPCAAGLLQVTPAPLRDALDALGWRSAYDDACAMDAARASGDPAACDALSLVRLRGPCRDRVAVAAGRPEACSLDGALHDPFCVALAARRPSLCRAVPLGRRAACEAILGTRGRAGPSEVRCGRPDVPDEAACRALAGAFAGLVPGERVEGGRTELGVRLRTARVVPLGSGRSVGEPEEDALGERELGATLRWEGCERILRVGEDDASSPRRPRYFVEVRWRGPVPARVRAGEGARVEIERDSFGEASAGGLAGGEASVDVARLEPELGGRLDLTVRGALSRSPGHVELELAIETVLRDVIGAPGPGCE